METLPRDISNIIFSYMSLPDLLYLRINRGLKYRIECYLNKELLIKLDPVGESLINRNISLFKLLIHRGIKLKKSHLKIISEFEPLMLTRFQKILSKTYRNNLDNLLLDRGYVVRGGKRIYFPELFTSIKSQPMLILVIIFLIILAICAFFSEPSDESSLFDRCIVYCMGIILTLILIIFIFNYIKYLLY